MYRRSQEPLVPLLRSAQMDLCCPGAMWLAGWKDAPFFFNCPRPPVKEMKRRWCLWIDGLVCFGCSKTTRWCLAQIAVLQSPFFHPLVDSLDSSWEQKVYGSVPLQTAAWSYWSGTYASVSETMYCDLRGTISIYYSILLDLLSDSFSKHTVLFAYVLAIDI